MKQTFHFPLRLLSIVLSVIICFGALPFVAAAENTGLFFEGESFAGSAVVTGGSAAKQDLSWLEEGVYWSNKAMLTWASPAKGDTLTLEVDIPTAGFYDLEIVLGASNDYGMVDVSMDGAMLWDNADTYNTGYNSPLHLKKSGLEVDAGKHTFVFTHAGQNTVSAGPTIAIDYIQFSEIESKLFYEGEEFADSVTVSGGSAAYNDLSGLSTTIWSNNAMLTWSNATEGNTLSVSVYLPADGIYNLEMRFGASWDYGKVAVSLDGSEIFAEVDTYKTAWDAPIKVNATDLTLTAGKHTFVLTHAGQNTASLGNTVSLDYIQFSEIESKLFYEGEEFADSVAVSGGSAAVQDLSWLDGGAHWSNKAMLTWSNATEGDTLSVSVYLPADGIYDLEIVLGASNDYGMVDVSMDGTVLWDDADTYNTGWNSPLHLKEEGVAVDAGKHTFVFTHAGQNTVSAGSTIAIDYIQFSETENVVEVGGKGYKTLPEAIDKAVEGDTITINYSLNANSGVAIAIPAGVTLDLNGKTVTVNNLLAFGSIIDSVGGGAVAISNDTTKAFVILQPGNPYLPIYDTANGCYRFFEYDMVSVAAKLSEADDNAVKFGYRINFADAAAYTLLANAKNASGIEMTIDLGWSGLSYEYIHTIKASTLQGYAAAVAEKFAAGEEVTTTIVLTVSGLNKLQAADASVWSTPTLSAAETRVVDSGDKLTYAVAQ